MAGVGKCFLVTGPPGVGKTTVIMRICESLKHSNPNIKLQGFYSQEIRQGGERVGFEVVTLDGRRGRLASSTISSPEAHRWPAVGKYKVDIASFESLVLPELKIREDTDLFIVDEVGKMELFSSYFFPAILNILQSNIPRKALPAVVWLKNHPGAATGMLRKSKCTLCWWVCFINLRYWIRLLIQTCLMMYLVHPISNGYSMTRIELLFLSVSVHVYAHSGLRYVFP